MEKSNQEIYDKIVEAFSKMAQETHAIRQQNAQLRRELEEYDTHIRDFYALTYDLKKTVESLNYQVQRLNEKR